MSDWLETMARTIDNWCQKARGWWESWIGGDV